MSKETLQLEGLAAQNFKGLKQIEVDFRQKGWLIVFGGENSAGKSSAMDVLAATIYGKAFCPKNPIRKGEKEAWTETRFDGLVARRVFIANRTRLEVKVEDSMKVMSPHTFLCKLFGTDSGAVVPVDPLGFLQLTPKEQVDVLRGVVGLDFAALDEERTELFDKRHGVNAEVRNLKERVESIQVQEDVPNEAIVVADLLEERKKREAANQQNRIVREDLAGLRREATDVKERIETLSLVIEELEASLKAKTTEIGKIQNAYAGLVAQGKTRAAEVKKLVDADVDEIDGQIKSSEEINAMIRSNQDRKKLEQSLITKEKEAQGLTERMNEIDTEKAKLVADAKFPVKGLAFDEDCVTFQGVDINQAALNEKIKVAVGLILALNPKAPAIVIDEGSGLDEASLTVLSELGEKYEKYIIVGRTSKGSEVTFLMKDGEVVSEGEDEE